MQTYKRLPVEFVRGEGATSTTPSGEPSTSTSSPASRSATPATATRTSWRRSASRPGACCTPRTSIYNEPAARLAERLAESFAARRARVPLQLRRGGERGRDQAGAQAPPGRRDRRARGRLPRAHDGSAVGDAAADKQEPFAPLVPGFVAVPRDDPDALAAAVGERTAAVMLEPVQGETGIWPISERMLMAAREACDRAGALLMFDEIQCGMGRTGHAVGVRADAGAARRLHGREVARERAADRRRASRAARRPRCSSPATTARPSAAGRWSPRRRSRRST